MIHDQHMQPDQDLDFGAFCEQGRLALALRDAMDNLALERFDRQTDAIQAACDAIQAAAAAPVVPWVPPGTPAPKPRIFTGYMPEEQRRAFRHGLYSLGVRKPPRRMSASDRAKSEAAKWGLAR